jgi:hypothetical protein
MSKKSISKSAKSLAGDMLAAATAAAADVAVERARKGAGGKSVPARSKKKVAQKKRSRPVVKKNRAARREKR